MDSNPIQNTDFGIYIHWPFCAKKCPYCDFNSHVQDTIDHDLWLDAYRQELKYYANETSSKAVTSIFFGGGTPSLMKPHVIEGILLEIRRLWTCSDELEITTEANPSSSESDLFDDFRHAGINRLSIGVQSLNNQSLQFLGRLHNAQEAQKALEMAANTFDRVSFDLIYALPDQTPDAWRAELTAALAYHTDHMSLYQLTIEPGTDFHKSRVPAAKEAIGAELYEITQEITANAGLPAYEISNHARPGHACHHNLVYWQGQDYLGIGPGAHGRLIRNNTADMIHNYRDPGKWLDLVQTTGTGQQKRVSLQPEERRDELIMMGLRLTDGISAAQFQQQTGTNLAAALTPDRLQALEKEGFIEFDGQWLKATADGRQRLNAVLAHLLT